MNYYYPPFTNDTYLNRLQRLNQMQNQFNQYANNITPQNNQIYKNGSNQIQATTSATSTSETNIVHMSFSTLVQVPQNNTCNCATSPTTIQIMNIGVPALFAQADLVVTKLC